MQRRPECIEYAKTRKQFGQTIGSFESVVNKIVDMKSELIYPESCSTAPLETEFRFTRWKQI